MSSEHVNPLELRKHRRYPYVANVMVALKEPPGQAFWGSSLNVSMGGMFISTTNPVPLDARLTADVYPEGIPPMRLQARVVHVHEGVGFGCIFTRCSQPSEILLSRWLGRCGGMPPEAGTITTGKAHQQKASGASN